MREQGQVSMTTADDVFMVGFHVAKTAGSTVAEHARVHLGEPEFYYYDRFTRTRRFWAGIVAEMQQAQRDQGAQIESACVELTSQLFWTSIWRRQSSECEMTHRTSGTRGVFRIFSSRSMRPLRTVIARSSGRSRAEMRRPFEVGGISARRTVKNARRLWVK